MLSYKEYLQEKKKGNLKDACWSGYEAIGMKNKNGRKVPNCVPVKEDLDIPKDAPSIESIAEKHKVSVEEIKKQLEMGMKIEAEHGNNPGTEKEIALDHLNEKPDYYTRLKKVEEQFDVIEEMVMSLAEKHNVDPETIWEKFEEIDDAQLLEYAVDAKGHKSSTGGLTQKGRDAYNAKGANLKPPVTTPPSKLKAGSKAANRRKSFCARMGGMEGPMKKPNGEPTRKALALRKWNC